MVALSISVYERLSRTNQVERNLSENILCLSTIKIFSVKRFMFPPHRSIGTRPCVSISATTHQVEIPAR